MKTVCRIFTIFFAIIITTTISMGMGYPQDMFAEHMTAKHKNPAQSKKVSKERMDVQKAACSQSAQWVNLQCTMPGKSKSIPKKDKTTNRRIATRLLFNWPQWL
jgi:hypothetical protein